MVAVESDVVTLSRAADATADLPEDGGFLAAIVNATQNTFRGLDPYGSLGVDDTSGRVFWISTAGDSRLIWGLDSGFDGFAKYVEDAVTAQGAISAQSVARIENTAQAVTVGGGILAGLVGVVGTVLGGWGPAAAAGLAAATAAAATAVRRSASGEPDAASVARAVAYGTAAVAGVVGAESDDPAVADAVRKAALGMADGDPEAVAAALESAGLEPDAASAVAAGIGSALSALPDGGTPGDSGFGIPSSSSSSSSSGAAALFALLGLGAWILKARNG